jgi:hypothetical protein
LSATARRAAASPCQRRKPSRLGSAMRVFHGPSSSDCSVSREW